ncbi:MAG: hypothetical protein K940chlam1_00618 [Candidatus Anoxychlamydiales bacterium]|nr:hypothetical protein [Candidatus Anoxychlamydiales bacterium]NGX36071.1 hypothetical protein [Candidatus Anoxychlamydiales bacterium]
MSVSAAKPYVQKAYDEIKVIVNDANRQIRNFNLKTIAKIIALVAVFSLGGALSVAACLKMGVAADIAVFAVFPSFAGAALSVKSFLTNNDSKKDQFVKNLNEDIREKLKYPRSIKNAVLLNLRDSTIFNTLIGKRDYVVEGAVTIPKIQLNSYDRAKNKYENDTRRHLPGFLQIPYMSGIGTLVKASVATFSMLAVYSLIPKAVKV